MTTKLFDLRYTESEVNAKIKMSVWLVTHI